MADWTMTNSPALTGGLNSNAVEVHVGSTTVPFLWTAAGSSFSTSALILLARIPHGAVVTGLQMTAWSGSADAHLDVGLLGQDASLFVTAGGASNSATSAFTLKTGCLPATCSLSDDTQPRYRYLVAKVKDGSSTVTAIVRGSITYVCGTGRSGL